MDNIKKIIYGKSQIAEVYFPSGLAEAALNEVKSILADLWLANPFTGEILLQKNKIILRQIYMHALVELMMRATCLSDVRLVIFKGQAIGKKAFERKCQDIQWPYYINKNMRIKVKADSVASKAFHETSLRDILSEILKSQVAEIVSGEHANEDTCIHADLYKDKLTFSISLAGAPLYKRGYRSELSASAPLREDIAAGCIQNALSIARKMHASFTANNIIIPFSGTGTFAFEYLLNYFQISPALIDRSYAIEKMPFFNKDRFKKLLDRAKEIYTSNLHSIKCNLACFDISNKANQSFSENIQHFQQSLNTDIFTPASFNIHELDFLAFDLNTMTIGNVFIPLNPPYGIRLNKTSDAESFYKAIALKINAIANTCKNNGDQLAGFILCPSEETWSIFCNKLKYSALETYHINQGGLDIRVCQFYI